MVLVLISAQDERFSGLLYAGIFMVRLLLPVDGVAPGMFGYQQGSENIGKFCLAI